MMMIRYLNNLLTEMKMRVESKLKVRAREKVQVKICPAFLSSHQMNNYTNIHSSLRHQSSVDKLPQICFLICLIIMFVSVCLACWLAGPV